MPSTHKLPELPKKGVKLFKKRKEKKKSERIINNITFFGDSAIPEGDEIYNSVFDAAKLLAENGFKIINGGGPGLMKAATDGAESINGDTVAVYWEPKMASIFEGKNLANIADETESQTNYVTRTFGLIEQGDVYIVCKGGTGTVSEFGLVWALAKLYFGKHKPVILYGDFWEHIIAAFKKHMYIDEKELGVLYYASEPHEILEIIKKHERMLDITKLRRVNGDESAFLLGAHAEVLAKQYDKHSHNYHSHLSEKLVAKEQLDDFISMINPPAQVLDIGCGPGYDAGYLSEKYAVTGIEISKRFCEIAQFENPNVDIQHGDISKIDLPKETYKGVWARDSIHHLKADQLDPVFKKIADSMVEDGVFYIIVREGEGEVDENEKKNYGNIERFYHLFTESELTERAEKAGFELVKIEHKQRSHKWLVGVFRKK